MYAAALLCCAFLAIVVRLPFLAVPLTNDEGGYAYVARLWAHGARLYASAWVDRPQGLVALFRLFTAVAPSTTGLRLCGALYVALSTVALAYVVTRLYGPVTGICAAALYALFSSGPQIEGFIVNGELLATLPTVVAIALLLRSTTSERAGRCVFQAGVAAGAALLVKQSAIDGVIVVLLFAPVITPGDVHLRLRRLAVALLGLATPLVLSALYGAATGWQAYLNAVVLDNLRYRSFDASAFSFANALTGLQQFWSEDAVLVVLAGLAVPGLVRARRALAWLPVPWLIATAVAVTLGGLFSRHYFVQVLPPLCVLAACGLTTGLRTARRWPWAWLLAVAPLAAFGMTVHVDAPYYAARSPIAISQRLYGWPVYTYQAKVVTFLRHRVLPGQPIFAAYAAAPLHYLSGRPSITPYLWRRPLGTIPGAYAQTLRAVQQGVPVCVIPVQPVSSPPGDGRMRVALARRYVEAWHRPGLTVFCRRP